MNGDYMDKFSDFFKSDEKREGVDELLEYNKWLVFYTDKDKILEIYHMIGLMEDPTQEEIDAFREEVRVDEEFGLGDKIDELSTKVVPKGVGIMLLEYFKGVD